MVICLHLPLFTVYNLVGQLKVSPLIVEYWVIKIFAATIFGGNKILFKEYSSRNTIPPGIGVV